MNKILRYTFMAGYALATAFMASPNALAADPIPGNPRTVHFNYNGGNSGNVNNGKDSDATLKRKAKIGSFNKIEASQGIKIFFSQGKNTGHAEVLTTPSAKDYISVTVEGGCLNAHYKRGFKSIKGPTLIYVSSPELREIDLSSSAKVIMETNLKQSKSLSIDLSSASKVDLKNVDCPLLEIETSSSASVNADVVNANLEIDASSASSVKIHQVNAAKSDIELSSASKATIQNFNSTVADIETSSAAGVTVNAMDCGKLNTSASSGSSIKLRGNYKDLRKQTGSGGSININGSSHSGRNTDRVKSKVREEQRMAREEANKARQEARKARQEASKAREQARQDKMSTKSEKSKKSNKKDDSSEKTIILREP